MAQTFLKTDGDIREVLHTMIYSPEFWSKDAYRTKIKTPFELVASATRAVGADVDVPLMLVQWTNRIGQPLYQCEPPTGYSDQGRCLGEHGRAAQPDEFFAGADGESPARRAGGYGRSAWQRQGSHGSARDARLARFSCCWAARCRRKRATRSKSNLSDPQILQATLDDPGQTGERGDDRGLGSGFAGISAALMALQLSSCRLQPVSFLAVKQNLGR